jgi:hypothetical protein
VDSDESLVQVLSSISHLTTLALEHSVVSSLVGLCAAPSLTSLTLIRISNRRRSFDLLCQLSSCTQLVHLALYSSCGPPSSMSLSDDEVCQLTPPSTHLPVLRTLVYCAARYDCVRDSHTDGRLSVWPRSSGEREADWILSCSLSSVCQLANDGDNGQLERLEPAAHRGSTRALMIEHVPIEACRESLALLKFWCLHSFIYLHSSR